MGWGWEGRLRNGARRERATTHRERAAMRQRGYAERVPCWHAEPVGGVCMCAGPVGGVCMCVRLCVCVRARAHVCVCMRARARG